ncbi:relaxase/mobilization nuclease domain-containing protein [Rathayibacter sp. AY1C5]|nr:relaxase/mobilization nuclease domain-containing protein [Rathayibacter sp. AY1C5]
MDGLMTYLAGEGRSNEHTEQHLIAGNGAIMAMHGESVLDHAAALAVARDLNLPKEAFGVTVQRAEKVTDPTTGELMIDSRTGKPVTEKVDADVWHCSLSLKAEEGQLSDEKWGQIATEFVRRMGFAGEDIGKADCRWVAVRHGLSKNGNDHIHIAVSRVREDGTKAYIPYDKRLAQKVSRELERDFDLQPLHAPERELGERGVVPGEREAARRRGAVEVDAHRLERAVRSAATSSADEGEFVRRMRQAGVLIRPRYAAGRDDVVAGYSVALRPDKGAPVVWHGGGRLARDLTLPELRKGWPDEPQTAQAAVDEWRATAKNPWRYEPVKPGREEAELSSDLYSTYAEDMTRLHDYLSTVDPSDRATWAHAAREASGAYAAWSRRLEPTPGPLAEASRQLARSAHLRAHESTPRPTAMPSMAGTTMLILATAGKRNKAAEEAMLLRQIVRTTRAIMDAHKAAGDARRTQELAGTIRNQLKAVHEGYNAQIQKNAWDALPEDTRRARETVQASFATGSPVPTKLTKAAPDATSIAAPQRGAEPRERDGRDR